MLTRNSCDRKGSGIESESGELQLGVRAAGVSERRRTIRRCLSGSTALAPSVGALLVVGAALLFVLLVLSKVLVVVVPVIVALFLSTVLVPPARWLRRRGWPPALATFAVFLLALRAGRDRRASRAHRRSRQHLAAELDERGIDRVQNWLVRAHFICRAATSRRTSTTSASRSSRTQRFRRPWRHPRRRDSCRRAAEPRPHVLLCKGR